MKEKMKDDRIYMYLINKPKLQLVKETGEDRGGSRYGMARGGRGK